MDENFSKEGMVDNQVLLPGTSIALPQLCTSADGRPCHILDQLPACNELLTAIRCRLDEETPDKLSLVSKNGLPENSATEAERREGCKLVFCLLRIHRCLDTVELEIHRDDGEPGEHQILILRSLRTAPALRELKLKGVLSSLTVMPELSCLSFLTRLETLECSVADSREMAAVLGRLLETSSCLTTLRLNVHVFSDDVSYAQELWAALATCKLLKSLQVGFWYFDFYTTSDNCMPFYESLEQMSTLTCVHIAYYCFHSAQGLKSVLKALGGNKGLVNVILQEFIVDYEEATAIGKFLAENSVIRNFELRSCCWRDDGVKAARYDTDDFGTLTPRILPWLSILKTNHVLQKLRFSFFGFSPAECAAFLEELGRNRTLRIVSIEDFQEYCCCLSRRGHRSKTCKVFDVICNPRTEIILAECEQIRPVKLYIFTAEHLAWFVAAALPLGLRHRVTEVKLKLNWITVNHESASVIAEFIKASNILTRLELDLTSQERGAEISEVRRTILKAVLRNSSIKDLDLWYPDCTVPDAVELAYAIGESKSICCLNLCISSDAGLLFLSHIFPSISCNYTLVRVHVTRIPHLGEAVYHRLLSVAARNRHLVARAAKFAAGSTSRACAEAMECVSSNPALVDELCELASADEIEACRMITHRLEGLQDLDNFMHISGVVKRRVVCQMYINGALQLDDVDRYSWHCVRKYLRLADVQK
ncbi:hypothetical protein HPB48_024561 [Haemaphysalis longicornis]|uniref:Nlr family card domain protein n=1 Tax=Haemaphysalis longicornis TaxID=44386 RepID=A0A9J6H8D0_HAELO|nr:hypothetical protein HPB48_024561 [Haemaphysalis longicornis]